MLSGGKRMDDGRVFGLLLVGDNCQNPDQRHLHATYRVPFANRERITVDLLYKTGLVDNDRIRRWGATVTYDWPGFFVRVGYDPKVNFTADNMRRISIGTRL
jgi:hypothetical protein